MSVNEGCLLVCVTCGPCGKRASVRNVQGACGFAEMQRSSTYATQMLIERLCKHNETMPNVVRHGLRNFTFPSTASKPLDQAQA